MGEPLTAIGAASSILTLLDFSWKLFSKTNEVHKSATGRNADNLVLETIIRDIEHYNAAIGDSSAFADTNLKQLIKESHFIATKLLKALNKLSRKKKKTIWSSFAIALEDIWKKPEIEAFVQRISLIQNQVTSHMHALILDNVLKVSEEIETLKGLRGSIGDEMRIQFSALKDQIEDATSSLHVIVAHRYAQAEQPRIRPLTDVVGGTGVSDVPDNLEILSRRVFDLEETSRVIQIYDQVLETLSFPSMKSRETNVAEAHNKTYEWIFKKTSEDGAPGVYFLEWLQSEQGIFWVHGRPGSGKSTLMKFIAHHATTLTKLQSWAGSKRILRATSYFWYAGNEMQKSQVGMLRSLLFDLLHQSLELGLRIERLLSADGKAHTTDWVNSGKYLLRILQQLIRGEPDLRFFFLIDGLDEYEEKGLTTLDLISSIQDLARNKNVKLCLASRPWSEFIDSFGSSEPRFTIQLQDLTRPDIIRYINDEFNQNSRFRQEAKQSHGFFTNLTTEICDRSRGVFLWVHLVVRDLLHGLTNGDDITLLQTRLARFPPDLNDFFQHMIDTVDPVYLPNTALWLEVARISSGQAEFMIYCFLDQISAKPAIWKEEGSPLSGQDITLKRESTIRQLDGRCRGLLEITRPRELNSTYHDWYMARVDFIHRTVLEFLSNSRATRAMIDSHVTQTFVRLALCKARLMLIKNQPRDLPQLMSVGLNGSFLDSISSLEKYTASCRPDIYHLIADAEQEYRRFSGKLPGIQEFFLVTACSRGIAIICEFISDMERTDTVVDGVLSEFGKRYYPDIPGLVPSLPALEALLTRALSFQGSLSGGSPFLARLMSRLWGKDRDDPSRTSHEQLLKVIGLLLELGVSIDTPFYLLDHGNFKFILRDVVTPDEFDVLEQAASRGRRRQPPQRRPWHMRALALIPCAI